MQTQSFPIVVSKHTNATHEEAENTRKRETVKKPLENEKVTKQHNGKDYKKISISFSSSISISLHSDNFINAQVTGKRKREVSLVIVARHTAHT